MPKINRRDFLKLGLIGASTAALSKIGFVTGDSPSFPEGERLGRTFWTVEIKQKPDPDSATLKTVYNDNILTLNREVIGKPYSLYWKKRIWYETPDGYIPAISVQPVKNQPNQPLLELPVYGEKPGMWVEVSVPYADLFLIGDKPLSPLLKEELDAGLPPRFFYSQVVYVDGIQTNQSGDTLYRVIQKFGTYGDTFWADARAFRPITPEEIAPITPDIDNKYIVVDINHQTMSCFENDREILFTRISSGAKNNYEGLRVEKWSTPPGDNHVVTRKYISLHMAGGDDSKASGYEQPAVAWTSIFATGGVAIHSTYWHNNYGEMLSHGCVNVEPDVAKFVFRWTNPQTPYDPGVIDLQGYSGTKVIVIDKDFE